MNAVLLPPPRLRFMGETDETFLPICDHLAGKVLAQLGERRRFDVLDVGCGYGRLAYGLARAGFDGSYRGFDILAEHVDWLGRHFDGDARFGFNHFNVHNARYNPGGVPFETLELPYQEGSVDCITSLSVFTHMYEDDIRLYLRLLGRALRDDGIWITTFFSVPDDFELARQNPAMRYPLTRQVAAHAFIHDPAEPLHVIAFHEGFLRRLIEEEGFRVADRQRGNWLDGGSAGEFQDWYVLRKATAAPAAPVAPPAPAATTVAPPAPAATVAPSAAAEPAPCNICGGTTFGPGPGGRLSLTGLPPHCRGCDSLERQRITRGLLQALPIGFLNWRRCLQFSPDQASCPAWFRSHELSIYGGDNSIDIQQISRPDASYEFVTLSHVLECIPDDQAAFAELVRIMAPRAILHLGLAGATTREHSRDLAQPVDPYGTLHLYGQDAYRHFNGAAHGLGMLVAEGTDPVTGVRDAAHFFTRHPADVALLRYWLAGWGGGVRVIGEAQP